MALYPGRVLEHKGQPDEEESSQGDVQLDNGDDSPDRVEREKDYWRLKDAN